MVLDAYLALVGAEQGLTFPDTGDLEADLRLVAGVHGGLVGRSGLRQRYRALLTAILDDPKLAAALLDRLLAVARGDQGAAAQRPAGGADRATSTLTRRRSCSTARSTTGGCCAPDRSHAEYVDAVVAMTLRALT